MAINETIKQFINTAITNELRTLSYNDLFTFTAEPYGKPIESRVDITNIEDFEAQINKHIEDHQDFIIYIQNDDTNFFAADTSTEPEDLEYAAEPDSGYEHMQYEGINIYLVID